MLYIQETGINATEGHCIGESDVEESFTDDRAELYRCFQREYGRCVGKVRVDPDGREIGWIFQSRIKYEDCDETYLREMWITVHTSPPTKTIEYHYA